MPRRVRYPTPNDRAAMEQHASPAALADGLEVARAERRRLDRHIAWLEQLHTRRTAEKAAGTWPPTDPRAT
jgi:hypothetical protein